MTHVSLLAADGRKLTMSLGRNLGASALTPGDNIGVDFAVEDAIALAGAAS